MIPTWIAVREHTPVEADKGCGSDEEQARPEVLEKDDQNKVGGEE